MGEWIRSSLDILLIAMVGVGLFQAMRLIKHLADLRKSRSEMERFVRDFNSTVIRAEAGIKGLRQAARDSGDDLEKLVEKALAVRDELHFIVESADQIAERLSKTASSATKPEKKVEAVKTAPEQAEATSAPLPLHEAKESAAPSSRAEKELLQALQKLS